MEDSAESDGIAGGFLHSFVVAGIVFLGTFPGVSLRRDGAHGTGLSGDPVNPAIGGTT